MVLSATLLQTGCAVPFCSLVVYASEYIRSRACFFSCLFPAYEIVRGFVGACAAAGWGYADNGTATNGIYPCCMSSADVAANFGRGNVVCALSSAPLWSDKYLYEVVLS